jgi:hypothetical protein
MIIVFDNPYTQSIMCVGHLYSEHMKNYVYDMNECFTYIFWMFSK